MRKLLFVFIFLFAKQFVFAGIFTDTTHISGQNILSVSVGQFHPNLSNLNSQLKTLGATKTFLPINAVGITWIADLNVNFGSYDAGFSFENFLPQQISIGDSLKYKMYGLHLMTSIYGKDLIPGKKLAIVLAPGIDWGSVYINGNLNGNKTHYKNPFISPFARAEVRYAFWKIALGARASYRYDISKKSWKQDSNKFATFPNSKFSGLGLQFFVGFNF